MFEVAFACGSLRVGVSLRVCSGYDYKWGQALLVQGKRVVESGTEGARWPPRVLPCPQHHDGVCRAAVVALASSDHLQCHVRRPQEGWEHEDHSKQQYHP